MPGKPASDQSHDGRRRDVGPLSIAVLAFNNMSSDPEQDYLADGLTEDIITALSKVRTPTVIARNSTFVYKRESPSKAINHFARGEYAEMIAASRAGLGERPEHVAAHRMSAVGLVYAGCDDEAAAAFAETKRLQPEISLDLAYAPGLGLCLRTVFRPPGSQPLSRRIAPRRTGLSPTTTTNSWQIRVV